MANDNAETVKALAVVLLPLLPAAVKSILDIINAVKSDPATPEDAKAQLDAISAQLDDIVTQVTEVRY